MFRQVTYLLLILLLVSSTQAKIYIIENNQLTVGNDNNYNNSELALDIYGAMSITGNITMNGSTVCTADNGLCAEGPAGTGDIESVTAGTGLTGGGTSGPVTLNLNSTFTTNYTNWNTAYTWGNHASAGYLTSETYTGISNLTIAQVLNSIGNWTGNASNFYNKTASDTRYLQAESFTGTSNLTITQVANSIGNWSSNQSNYATTASVTTQANRVTEVNGTALARAATGNCAAGQVIQNITTSGVQCVTDSSGSGDIEGITTAVTSGLQGGCTSGTCTLSVNATTCASGNYSYWTGTAWACAPDSGATGGDGNNYPASIDFTGTTTKTLNLARSGLANLTASFTDIDTDTWNTSAQMRAAVNGSYMYSFGITGNAATATTASNSDQLGGQTPAYYWNTTSALITAAQVPYQSGAGGWTNTSATTSTTLTVTAGNWTINMTDGSITHASGGKVFGNSSCIYLQFGSAKIGAGSC